MSVRVMGWVWQYSANGGSDLLLELALADCAHDDGSSIYPSVAYMARKTRMSERAVRYILRKLVASGELSEDGEGPQGTKQYRINMRGGAKFAGVQSLQGCKITSVGGAKFAADPLLIEPSERKLKKLRSQIPKDFALSPEMAAYAVKQGINPATEFQKFRDYYEAKGTAWLDWTKVWQLWCRGNRESYANKAAAAVSPYGPPKPHEQLPVPSEEERRASKQRLRELMAGIGMPVIGR